MESSVDRRRGQLEGPKGRERKEENDEATDLGRDGGVADAAMVARGGLRSGYLMKLGINIRMWKRRFFVLRPIAMLFYYLSEYDREPRGCVDLDLFNDVKRLPTVGPDGQVRFELSYPGCPAGQGFLLEAKNGDEWEGWLDALTHCSFGKLRKQLDIAEGSNRQLAEEVQQLESQVSVLKDYANQRHKTTLALRDERQRRRELVQELAEVVRLASQVVAEERLGLGKVGKGGAARANARLPGGDAGGSGRGAGTLSGHADGGDGGPGASSLSASSSMSSLSGGAFRGESVEPDASEGGRSVMSSLILPSLSPESHAVSSAEVEQGWDEGGVTAIDGVAKADFSYGEESVSEIKSLVDAMRSQLELDRKSLEMAGQELQIKESREKEMAALIQTLQKQNVSLEASSRQYIGRIEVLESNVQFMETAQSDLNALITQLRHKLAAERKKKAILVEELKTVRHKQEEAAKLRQQQQQDQQEEEAAKLRQQQQQQQEEEEEAAKRIKQQQEKEEEEAAKRMQQQQLRQEEEKEAHDDGIRSNVHGDGQVGERRESEGANGVREDVKGDEQGETGIMEGVVEGAVKTGTAAKEGFAEGAAMGLATLGAEEDCREGERVNEASEEAMSQKQLVEESTASTDNTAATNGCKVVDEMRDDDNELARSMQRASISKEGDVEDTGSAEVREPAVVEPNVTSGAGEGGAEEAEDCCNGKAYPSVDGRGEQVERQDQQREQCEVAARGTEAEDNGGDELYAVTLASELSHAAAADRDSSMLHQEEAANGEVGQRSRVRKGGVALDEDSVDEGNCNGEGEEHRPRERESWQADRGGSGGFGWGGSGRITPPAAKSGEAVAPGRAPTPPPAASRGGLSSLLGTMGRGVVGEIGMGIGAIGEMAGLGRRGSGSIAGGAGTEAQPLIALDDLDMPEGGWVREVPIVSQRSTRQGHANGHPTSSDLEGGEGTENGDGGGGSGDVESDEEEYSDDGMEAEYELEFFSPRIGLQFKMSEDMRLVVVGRNGFADPSSTRPFIGDVLVSYNDVPVRDKLYAEVAAELKSMGRPLRMRFSVDDD